MRAATSLPLLLALATAPWAPACSSVPSLDPDGGPLADARPVADGPDCPSTEELAQVIGTWHLDANHSRLTLRMSDARPRACLRGSVLIEEENGRPGEGLPDRLGPIRFDPASGELIFRRQGDYDVQWFRLRVNQGILSGRFSSADEPEEPTDPTVYGHHVTGWNQDVLDEGPVPRVFRLRIGGEQRAWLRIDRPAKDDPGFLIGPSGLVGRLKVYGTVTDGAKDEDLEQDVEVVSWDGRRLTFVTHDEEAGGTPLALYRATASGRVIDGTISPFDSNSLAGEFTGWRANVLAYGLAARTPLGRQRWQERTRSQLEQLFMAGNPAPLSMKVTLGEPQLPRESEGTLTHRDDRPEDHPQAYRWQELFIEATLPDPAGGEPLVRKIHGVMTTPTDPAPEGGYPAALLVNGHDGSAMKLMNPDDVHYWYGDSYARRGFVVVAIDMSHRPYEHRRGLYSRYLKGDHPEGGNHSHPAIQSPGMDSDWEEDGERIFDARRGLDHLLSLPDIDASRVVVSGLSMGGEISSLVGALDPRVTLVLPQGYSPDYGVTRYRGNHPCWRWNNGEIDDYIDQSDVLALMAPRSVIVTTNRRDKIFSYRSPPYAADRQVKRRAGAAWLPTDAYPAFFLHSFPDDVHHYHVGEAHPDNDEDATGIVVPAADGPRPGAPPWSTDWQTELRLSATGKTLFDYVRLLGNE